MPGRCANRTARGCARTPRSCFRSSSGCWFATFPITRARSAGIAFGSRDLDAAAILSAIERSSGSWVLSAELVSRQHVHRLTVVRCRGPHPVRGEAEATAARGARSRCQRRLPRAYAPSGCGHPIPHPDGTSWLGRRMGLAQSRDFVGFGDHRGESPGRIAALAIVLSLTPSARAIARSLIPSSRRCFALSAIFR